MPLDDFVTEQRTEIEKYNPRPVTFWERFFHEPTQRERELNDALWRKFKRDLEQVEDEDRQESERKGYMRAKSLEADKAICDVQTDIHIQNETTRSIGQGLINEEINYQQAKERVKTLGLPLLDEKELLFKLAKAYGKLEIGHE